MKRNSNEDGFTLVEVMIVVIILAILAGVALVSFGGLDKQAKDARVHADLRAIATALKGYKALTGGWPAALTDLTTASGNYTPLIDSIPDDPYAAINIKYIYDDTATPTTPVIYSIGANGTDDGGSSTAPADDIAMTVQ